MFKLIASGNIGQNAEVKEINGQLVLTFSLAHNTKSKDQQGNVIEKTTWISCSQWKEKTGRFPIVQYLTKGSRVVVEGTPAINMFRDQQGNQRAGIQVRISDIHLMSSTNTTATLENHNQQPPATQPPTPATDAADDLPF